MIILWDNFEKALDQYQKLPQPEEPEYCNLYVKIDGEWVKWLFSFDDMKVGAKS